MHLLSIMILLPLRAVLLLSLPHHEFRIHTNNTPNQVPIAIEANPIRDKDTSRPVRALLVAMSPAKMINRSRVQLFSNLLRPRSQLEEVTRAQEIDIEWVRLRRLGTWENTERVAGLACSFAVFSDVLNLLVDVLGFENFVEVLDDDLTTRAGRVRAVVGPACSVNTPSSAAVDFFELFEHIKAADKDDLAAGFAEGWDFGIGVPSASWAAVMIAQDAAELLVSVFAGSLTFKRNHESFGGIVLEEIVNFAHEVAEVLVSS